MHLQPIDNTEMEPFTIAMDPEPRLNTHAEPQETFDDVWGSAPASPTIIPLDAPAGTHPSDMPRLQAEHTTAGYREGVTAAKATSIQAGFDEGFSLGAEIGSLSGQLLGLLEGIANALDGQEEAVAKEAQRVFEEARKELKTDSIFGPDFWNTDGTWKFDVEKNSADEILFSDVARAHPLIKKWTKSVDAEIDRWGIVVNAIGDADEHERQPSPERVPSSAVPQTKKVLDW
ncbi:ABC1 domain containing protein [Colletotrichum truncatum]|uniref:ABC1 domain containing protein n=1 Tax=Colletotrichum truncatum TaxID=5467 RepID=A0ACC3Z0R0_COLTU|nr:ABC1 domain containing protein [Colletotrichum truncatum]KAF6800554.1 ABC1 domain containing protein [Colletotrichum truncatum]